MVIFLIIEVFGNFYKIDKYVYRSGKLNSYNLQFYHKIYNFKTIINLHGKSSKSWYKDEKNISKQNDITHIDFKLKNSIIYDTNTTKQLVQLMKDAKKPMLIHCLGGADRTSLASALYIYAIKNSSKQEANKQFAWYYGHLPMIRKKVIAMDRSFDLFVDEAKKDKNED